MDLLLLPEPPSELSLSTFRAAYGLGLHQVFSKLSQNSKQTSISLDIALQCDSIPNIRSSPRSANFSYIQELLKHVYMLTASILAEQHSSTIDDVLDIRVFIVYTKAEPEAEKVILEQGPILPLKVFAASSRLWTDVFTLDGESGEGLLHDFSAIRKSQPQSSNLGIFSIHRIAGGTVITTPSSREPPSSTTSTKEHRIHKSIAVGGTFDHLHLGHKLLLTATALLLDPARTSTTVSEQRILTVGITTSALLTKKAHASVLESWPRRQEAVINFLLSILSVSSNTSLAEIRSESFTSHPVHGSATYYHIPGNLVVRCVEIDDAFGPTITDEAIDALAVSQETRKGGQAVNEKRRDKGWGELDVLEVGVLDAGINGEVEGEEFASKISSTEIRRKIVERQRMDSGG